MTFRAYAQQVEKIDTASLRKLVNIHDNKLHIINFWATWCSPCVSELPHFEKIMGEYPENKVDFLFISLDFPSTVQKSLIPFINGRPMQSRVVLMSLNDADAWINMIDKYWQGDIPATLVYRTSDNTRLFHAGAMDYNELKTIINNHL